MAPRKSAAAATPSADSRGKKRAAQTQTPVTASASRKRKRTRLSSSPAAEDELADDPRTNGSHAVQHNEDEQRDQGEEIVVEDGGVPAEGAENGEVMDAEKEMEAWLDFAQDHYEMVEQLPLELHRNFRLLKELDDGCIAQTEKLQKLIRRYISERQVLARELKDLKGNDSSNSDVPGEQQQAGPSGTDTSAHVDATAIPAQAASSDAPVDAPTTEQVATADRCPAMADVPIAEDGPAKTVQEEVLGVPVPDGHGGLVVPALDETAATPNHPRAFPSTLVKNQPSQLAIPVEATAAPSSTAAPARATQKPLPKPYLVLPEIGRLAREIVRNGEEKVAVAIGAYNSIDRHIRALDSALSVQEASILLGLRPDTLPSAFLEPGLAGADGEGGQDGQAAGQDGAEDDDEINIGIGGGGAGAAGAGRKGRKGRKGKKGGKKTQTAELVAQEKKEEETAPDPLLSADP